MANSHVRTLERPSNAAVGTAIKVCWMMSSRRESSTLLRKNRDSPS